jgi:hypothetical protein
MYICIFFVRIYANIVIICMNVFLPHACAIALGQQNGLADAIREEEKEKEGIVIQYCGLLLSFVS